MAYNSGDSAGKLRAELEDAAWRYFHALAERGGIRSWWTCRKTC